LHSAVSAGQPARSAAECGALWKKLDSDNDGRIMESSVASEPTIAAGFSDPKIKERGYMTAGEFTALCTGGKLPPSNG
jgi:hypothetical protein